MATRRTRRTAPRRVTRRPATRRMARPWTREEMQFMRKYYRNYETAWIARQLGRTVYAVRYKAVDLSLKKASPSVWRGNRGADNAFRKPSNTRSRRPAPRRTAKRRPTRTRGFRATSRRRVARKASPRRIKRTRR